MKMFSSQHYVIVFGNFHCRYGAWLYITRDVKFVNRFKKASKKPHEIIANLLF